MEGTGGTNTFEEITSPQCWVPYVPYVPCVPVFISLSRIKVLPLGPHYLQLQQKKEKVAERTGNQDRL